MRIAPQQRKVAEERKNSAGWHARSSATPLLRAPRFKFTAAAASFRKPRPGITAGIAEADTRTARSGETARHEWRRRARAASSREATAATHGSLLASTNQPSGAGRAGGAVAANRRYRADAPRPTKEGGWWLISGSLKRRCTAFLWPRADTRPARA
ncbi:hypothetical protein MRX96_009672 [Rhipicephalus microplus]